MEAILLARKNAGLPVTLVVGGQGLAFYVIPGATIQDVRGDAVLLLTAANVPFLLPYSSIAFVI